MQPMLEKAVKRQKEELKAHEVEFATLQTLSSYTQEPAFYHEDGECYISDMPSERYEALYQSFKASRSLRKMANNLVQFLITHKGERAATLLGFSPVQGAGGTRFIDIEFLFGKLYLPNVKGFSAKLTLKSITERTADIRLRFPGINGGATQEYTCTITDTLPINQARNLVIHVCLKAVKWINETGTFFYTCEVVNHSNSIVAKKTRNLLDTPKGFEILRKRQGIVNRFDTDGFDCPQERSEEVRRKSVFDLDARLSTRLLGMGIEFKGQAIIENTIKVMYSIPPNGSYLAYVSNNKKFQHLWSHRAPNRQP